jgi:enoyl-CoA hydratase/carnithine racemase
VSPGLAPEVLVSREGSVALVTLSRPDKLNAWTPLMSELYQYHLDELDRDTAVRAVVVTGAGRGFCAGGDLSLKLAGKEAGADSREPFVGAIHAMKLRKPVIAAINGACAGAGLTVALTCDLRFAASGAKFSSAFARRGRVGTPGLPWLLSRLTGPAVALDLLLSGRTFDAEEAARLGLVNTVTAREKVVDDALSYARELCAYSAPRSMAVLKRAVYTSLDESFQEAVETGKDLLAQSRDWPEASEGVKSYAERRLPDFPPLPS